MSEWAELESIFWQCISGTAEQRAEILAQTKVRNPELADEARRLLAAHEEDSTSIDEPPRNIRNLLPPEPGVEAMPERIGPFQIIRELGKGGMGSVYLGKHAAADFEQLVAIKVIKKGLDFEAVIERFRRERRILARLEHPHIARFYYGGASDENLPYFVMEFVPGERITEYCRSQQLATAETIVLFRKVCDAVQYAHENLVIHRDIKPSNILVDKNGEPKLLDFGVAKWLSAEDPAHTIAALGAGFTRDYASPEQLRNEAVTTATDIFSLGVVLHEMLAGERPVRGNRVILRPRDLARVIQKALENDTKERYRSASEFSSDLKRFLDGQPVGARPQTLPYVLSRFILRKPALSATFGLFILSLAAAMGWAIRERGNAYQSYAALASTSDRLVFELPALLDELPGATAARGLALDSAVQALDQLAADPHRTRELTQKIAFAYEHYGDTQGNTSFQNLGDSAAALRSYEKSLALRESLAAEATPHADVGPRRDLAATYERIGSLQATRGDRVQAKRRLEQALRCYEGLTKDAPTDRALQTGLSEVYVDLGKIALLECDEGLAARDFQSAQRIVEGLVKTKGDDREAKRTLSLIYKQNAVTTADFSFAHELLRRAKELDDEQLKGNRGPVRAREDLAQGYSDLGTVCMREGDMQCAQEAFDKSLTMRTALSASDQADARMRRFLAVSYCNLGGAQTRLGAYASAELNLKSGLALLASLLDHDPGNTKLLRESAMGYQALADTFLLAANRHIPATNALTECEKAKHAILLCKTFWALENHIVALPPADEKLREQLGTSENDYERTCAGARPAATADAKRVR